MDRDELEIYLELAKEAEAAGDYKTADKIDGMIKTSAFDKNRLPVWAQNFINGARTPAERASRLREILDGISSRGRSNFLNDLGYARRLRRKRDLRTDQLSGEQTAPAMRGEVGGKGSFRSKVNNLFFTRGKAFFEPLSQRFKDDVDDILPRMQAAIDAEVTRLRGIPAHAGLSDDALKTLALQSPTVSRFIRSLRTPMSNLLHRTQMELKRKIEEAARLITSDPVTRTELGLTGAFNPRDLSMVNIGRVISARYEKFLGPNSEITDEMFKRFWDSGTLTNGVFRGGRIDPTYFFTKQGGGKLMPTGLSYIIPAMFAGGAIVKIIDPPGPKPGPDVVPVAPTKTKLTNELAQRHRAGLYDIPESTLQAYLDLKKTKGQFTSGVTTKRQIYDLAYLEKGEHFANNFIQWLANKGGLLGGTEKSTSPITDI